MTNQKSVESYEKAWREYRVLVTAAYAFIPAIVGVIFLNDAFSFVHPVFVMLTCIAVAIVMSVRTLAWPCPRCDAKLNGFFGSPLRRLVCRKCGLKRFEIPI